MSALLETWYGDGPGHADPISIARRHLPVEPGGLIAGRYRLNQVIGQGGMATVYRGFDERLGRQVAVKICDAGGVDDTPLPPLQEERVASTFIHENIVSVFDGGEIPSGEPGAGTTYIVMQYVDGRTAQEAAPVSWRHAVEIVRQACDGLAAAHARGIVHCDVKPSNILIATNGRVLVADFGVAATAGSESGEFVHGSRAYLAPERLRGARPDPRVDVYGLGGVLEYLMSGRTPDDASAPRLPAGCPSEIGQVIRRSRSADPQNRYGDAEALRRALDLVVSGAEADTDRVRSWESTRAVRREPPSDAGNADERDETTAPAVVRTAERRPVDRWPLVVGGAVVLLVALLVVAAVVLRSIVADEAATASGPAAAPIQMPDLRNQTFGAAVQAMAEQGVTIDRIEILYGPGPLNRIVAQEPPPGVLVTNDDDIVVVVLTPK